MIGIQIKYVYPRTDFKQLRIHSSTIHYNALHYLVLIKLNAARFVRRGICLISYCNDHTK